MFKTKKMLNKGFTLIELLAVLSILLLFSLIAIPRIIIGIDNNKKEAFISDAKKMVSSAKYKFSMAKYKDIFYDKDGCKVVTLSDLKLDIVKDPDNNLYSLKDTEVYICLIDDSYNYFIKLTPLYSGRGTISRINIDDLKIKDIVKVK